MDTTAVICKDCEHWLWKDHSKLEEYFDNHEKNKEFSAKVIKEVQKKMQSVYLRG